MKICLLIINYNGMKYLPDYLGDISTFCKQNGIKLIITDDQSKDESIEFIQKSGIEFTINKRVNHGFAANINHGIRYALESDDFDYFIISNNDIEISEEVFFPLKRVLEVVSQENQKLGLIGFDEINKDRFSYFKEFDYSSYDNSNLQEVEHIPGFFFIISKELIKEIGYFDEEYFMYGEDDDYFWRARKAGFKIYNSFLPIMHYSEGSSTNDKLTSWYIYRNGFLFAQKHLGLLKTGKLFLSFIKIIYNPFYKSNYVNSQRIKRNGFLYNNYLLFKSLIWNLNYFYNNKFRK